MEQMEQMFQMFPKLNKPNPTENLSTIQFSEKLNYNNYTKWSRLMQIAINSRGKLNHITNEPSKITDPNYPQCAPHDSIVISWIIENIDAEIVNQFIDYNTARDLWQEIENLLNSGHDELQIYDLSSIAATLRQEINTIETYFEKLSMLWKEIDGRMPNFMTCPQDITAFNNFIQRQRLYQFLTGINEDLDKERRDLLHMDPLPTVEVAYATIRREISRRKIMTGVSSPGIDPSEFGSGLAVKNKNFPRNRETDDWQKLRCSHCGGSRHTKEGCFKLVGYPDWWDDLQKRKAAIKAPAHRTGGKANLANTDHPGETTSSYSGMDFKRREEAAMTEQRTSKRKEERETAVNHTEKGKGRERVPYNPTDPPLNTKTCPLSHILPGPDQETNPNLTHILPGSIQDLIHKFSLMSHKYSKWIFDCGATDTMTFDPHDLSSVHSTPRTHVQTANGTTISVHQAGPADISSSLRYSNGDDSWACCNLSLDCETCVLGKSHKHSYSPGFTRTDRPFELVHSDVWGPAPESNSQGYSYFVLFLDDCTRVSWIYFLKKKSEVFDVFVNFYNMILTQFHTRLKIIRSDNGGEYDSHKMKNFTLEHGMLH
ncbi:uncharacterized protein LOC130805723 [Amaranthus tricolor]|uniref:uncharacterized protein LOC130805723 n=1 Tax=Amaranthus tricolor TaxID=29722 RepID=UPI00258F0F40|nr:uncharacterized protein LOC130805723 [Amaranthus tricolor]